MEWPLKKKLYIYNIKNISKVLLLILNSKEKENNIKFNLFLKRLCFIEEYMINISENGISFPTIGCLNGLTILNKTLQLESSLFIKLQIEKLEKLF